MTSDRGNVVLIGMPGAGKSTVGVILAKHTSRNFIDTDVLIQTIEDASLQGILDERGYMGLREAEERILLGMHARNHVVATGGSAAYSRPAMEHLKQNGIVVFLQVELPLLRSRIKDFDTRGIAKRPDQSFADLYEERSALYRKYADVTVDCLDLCQEDIARRIAAILDERVPSVR